MHRYMLMIIDSDLVIDIAPHSEPREPGGTGCLTYVDLCIDCTLICVHLTSVVACVADGHMLRHDLTLYTTTYGSCAVGSAGVQKSRTRLSDIGDLVF